MPKVVARSDFALAVNQVCAERGIKPEVVLETMNLAIASAYRKDFGGQIGDCIVKINPDTGEARIFEKKEEGASGKDITPPGFGRIAAQTAKQVILQKIREAEKQAIVSDYSQRIGSLVNGMILRFDGQNIIVDIGRGQGILPFSEQVPAEFYRINQRLTFYLQTIRQGPRGDEIIVSRRDENLIAKLFEREVPEVQNKSVEVKVVAREAGSRSKVAVLSKQSGVDPVGSCVGQKGVRVQAVIKEINGEKIDLVQYSDDPILFILQALQPASNLKVSVNAKSKMAKVVSPDDQLSLAIGREGQNVRLAAKLTGYKIDIQGIGKASLPSKQTKLVRSKNKSARGRKDLKAEKNAPGKTEK